MGGRESKFRFYLDENIPALAAEFLRGKGHNVTHVIETKNRRSLKDLRQILLANKEEKIFIALDKDFSNNSMLFGAISMGPGIILIRSADPRAQKVVEVIKHVAKDITPRKLKGKLCIATVDGIKYKKFQF